VRTEESTAIEVAGSWRSGHRRGPLGGLIVPGVRILRAGRPAQARLRLTPLAGGVLVSGRF